jgi:hypothetical protein
MTARNWWRDGVLYQRCPRSFQDSRGDGVGELRLDPWEGAVVGRADGAR